MIFSLFFFLHYTIIIRGHGYYPAFDLVVLNAEYFSLICLGGRHCVAVTQLYTSETTFTT